MEKGLKMTIKISEEMLKKLSQGDENHPKNFIFEDENGDRISQKNESE